MRFLPALLLLLLLAGCQPAITEAEYSQGAASVAQAATAWTKDAKNPALLSEAIKQGEALQDRARGTPIAEHDLFKGVSLLTGVMKAVQNDVASGADPNGTPSGSQNSRKESVQQGIMLVQMGLPGQPTPKVDR